MTGNFRFRYREDLTYADSAFEAEGESLDELFQNAADALTQLMVENIESIEPKSRRHVHVFVKKEKSEPLCDLLQEFLQSLVYWKDVDQLFLRARNLQIRELPALIELEADLEGESMDPKKHVLGTDVKAVTFHQLRVWEENHLWKAVVVVDT